MKIKKLIYIGIGMLNFVGLGLGSFFLQLWKRGLPSLLVSLGLLAAVFVTQNLLLIIPLVIWLLLVAADGWNQARKQSFEEGFLAERPWSPLALSLVLVGVYVLGGFSFVDAAQVAYDDGMDAYRSADCSLAVQNFELVTGIYQVANERNNGLAQQKIRECEYLIVGQAALDEGEFQKALEAVDFYLTAYPGSPITQQVIDQGGESYLQWAGDLRSTSEYKQAIETYSKLARYYPTSSAASDVPDEITNTQIEWGDEYLSNQEYDSAIDTYRVVLNDEPKISTVSQVEEKIGAVYLDFGASLRLEDNFEQALDKYQVILDDYSGTSAAVTAQEEFPNTYLQWGNHLLEVGEEAEALVKFRIVIEEFLESAAAEEALSALVLAYLAQGKELAEQGKINASVEAYETILDLTEDAASVALAETAIAVAITLLSTDIGEEGQQLMQNSLLLACDEKATTSEAIYTLGEDEPGKYLICEDAPKTFYLSQSLEAKFPGEFRFAIKFKISTTNYSAIRYGGFYGNLILIRSRVDWNISVIEVETGEVFLIKNFRGGGAAAVSPFLFFQQQS